MEKLYSLSATQKLYLQSCYDCGVKPDWSTLKKLDDRKHLNITEIDKRGFYEK